MSNNAKDNRKLVLDAIRHANEHAPKVEQNYQLPKPPATSEQDFLALLEAGPATIDKASSHDEIPELVARFCEANDLAPKVAVASSVAKAKAKLDWSKAKLETKDKWDDELSLAVTGCRAAILETAQFVVDNSGDDSWLSLVAPIHVVVIEKKQLVATLEDLAKIAGEKIPGLMTLVYGPSRTGDIEQTLILGAHGPGKVHVIYLTNESKPS